MKEQYKIFEDKMTKSLEKLSKDYVAIRAGRANPAILDKVKVEYYGVSTPVNQMAAISIKEARVLAIQPWDISTLPMIEKAINLADIGINPTNDGKMIRLCFPQLTEERRKEIVKDISKLCEECKVAIRNIRRDAIDKFKNMKKNSEITEDDLKTCEKDIQTMTDKYCKEADTMSFTKEKEIMSI